MCDCDPPLVVCAVQFRVLLRREQVLKVACNHLITASMELRPMATSETAWCWLATDYTDSEPRLEQFAVKFKVSRSLAHGRVTRGPRNTVFGENKAVLRLFCFVCRVT